MLYQLEFPISKKRKIRNRRIKGVVFYMYTRGSQEDNDNQRVGRHSDGRADPNSAFQDQQPLSGFFIPFEMRC